MPTVVGGVSVSSGDIVVVDIDGVAVVPEEVAVEVLEEAEREMEAENELRADLEDGIGPVEAYEKHEMF